jgi:hypothetical protein
MSNVIPFETPKKRVFIDRFEAFLILHAHIAFTTSGRPLLDYAREVGAIHWNESLTDHLSPEEHAKLELDVLAEDLKIVSRLVV